MMKFTEKPYSVVWPLGRRGIKTGVAAPRLESLEGKTICELWNYLYGGDQLFPLIEEILKEQFPHVKFINYDKFGNTHGKNEKEVIAALPGKLAEFGCDVVISATGG